MEKRKTKEIELVAAGLTQSFENENHLRAELRARVLKSVEDKANQSKLDLEK